MNRFGKLSLSAIMLLAWPELAHAQKINAFYVGLALSPIVGGLLSVILWVVVKSWKIGLASMGAVGVWVAWFVLASMYTTSDLVIWTPIFGLGIQLAVLVFLIG